MAQPLSRQDEQFLRMIKVTWETRPPAAAQGSTISRAEYEEAMRFAEFYEEESHQKSQQIEELTAQRNYMFLAAVAGLAGMAAAASILITIKIAS